MTEPINEKVVSMTVRRTIKKDGTIVEKHYNQTEYNKTCYAKNKERYSQSIPCLCGKTYSVYTKSNHFKSQIHKLFERMNIISEELNTVVEEDVLVAEPECIHITFPVFD